MPAYNFLIFFRYKHSSSFTFYKKFIYIFNAPWHCMFLDKNHRHEYVFIIKVLIFNNRCKLIIAIIFVRVPLWKLYSIRILIFRNNTYRLIANSSSFAISLGCITEFQVSDSGIHCSGPFHQRTLFMKHHWRGHKGPLFIKEALLTKSGF